MGPTPTEEIIPAPLILISNFHILFLSGDKRSAFLRLTNLLPSYKQDKLSFLTKVDHIPLFLSQLDMLCGEVKKYLFDFSLKSKVCDMESEPLILPYLTYEKQLFYRLAFLFAHRMHYWNGLLKTF